MAKDSQLTGIMIDYFLGILSSSCLYETAGDTTAAGGQNIATHQPFSIFCALRELLAGEEIKEELRKRFADIFALLLTSVAVYTNLAPPSKSASPASKSGTQSAKSKFGFIPNKELIKVNPCQVILDTFEAYLKNIEMEQLAQVLTVEPHLALSKNLDKFLELLTPMAGALVGQLGITSSAMTHVIDAVGKYISSPYENQRIAAVGLYSQLVPLRPNGDLASMVMKHLNSALSDSNALVRGFCIRGMAYVGDLNEHDVDKYSEMSLAALLKGIDDNNSEPFINIPLDSMKGLSRIVMALHKSKLETFQVSLAIRIRPFFENASTEIREAAILLFGDLCRIRTADYGTTMKMPIETMTPVSDALREQIFLNFFSLFLHMSETDAQIVRVSKTFTPFNFIEKNENFKKFLKCSISVLFQASKTTLRKISTIINAQAVNELVQSHILEHGKLQFDNFLPMFLKIIVSKHSR